jgi:hypothetical protein
MSTQAQILANQANAKHSTGPRSEAGKTAVSANATTHGATSKQPLIKGESLTEYQTQIDQFEAEFKPVTLHEQFLLREMAGASWRMRRLHMWEMLILENCPAGVNPFDDNDQFKKLNRAHRHIQSIERSYHRAHRELIAARKPQNPETEPAKTPAPEQSQIPVKCFSYFENTWNGKVNITQKNPGPNRDLSFSKPKVAVVADSSGGR